MKKIEGSPKNLKQLLQNTKYSIHYYQREYMWQRKHIEELIDDLTSEFLEYYKTDDPRQAVADYGAYFMGSIVLAGRENAIIDGQQRFSSLTLLLMYLNNRLKTIGQSYNMIETMIFSESFGTKSFKLGLNGSDDFELFIKKFAKFADVYELIRQAETIFVEETKYVYYNAQVNFTLQPQLLLAPVCYEDSWPVIVEKINLVARFIDVLIVSRVTNYRSVDYSTIKNFVFNVTKDIRMTDIPTLKQKLEQQYINLAFDPAAALSDLRLNSFTKKYIKNILARITGYIEEQTGVTSNYCNYMNTQTKNPFEIEHIITDHYEWFTAEYSDQDDFRRWRNSIGALLLLHKSLNASLNDAKYDYKLKKYCSNEGNIYTESLGELAYQNNPKFKKFIADNSLGFKAYASFGKNEIAERIAVLVDLVKLVWNDDMFI